MATQDQTQQHTNQRPQRRDFMRTVVIGPNAQVVDPKEWKSVVGDTEGREMRRKLKEKNWTSTRVFDSIGYDAAVKDFRDHARNKTQESRKSLFQKAFEDAGVNPHPRIESALRTVLPLMDPEDNETRVVRALGKIVSAVDSVMVDAKRGGQGKDAKAANDEPQGGDKQAKGDEQKDQKEASAEQKDQKTKEKSDRDQTAEELKAIAKVKEQYDSEVDKAMNDQNMDKVAELKTMYDKAVEKIMGGEIVDDMFSMSEGKKNGNGNGNGHSNGHSNGNNGNNGKESQAAHAGTDGVRSEEKEDEQGNFVPKVERRKERRQNA